MGNCIFCGKPAGFLKRKHKNCQQIHDNGVSKLKTIISEALQNKSLKRIYDSSISTIIDESFIKEDEYKTIKRSSIYNYFQRLNSEGKQVKIQDIEQLSEYLKEDNLLKDKLIKDNILSELASKYISCYISENTGANFNDCKDYISNIFDLMNVDESGRHSCYMYCFKILVDRILEIGKRNITTEQIDYIASFVNSFGITEDQLKKDYAFGNFIEAYIESIINEVSNSNDNNKIEFYVNEFVDKFNISKNILKSTAIRLFDSMVDNFLSDNFISVEEESIVVSYKEAFDLSQQEINVHHKFEKVAQSVVLRNIRNGKIPNNFDASLPIVLGKTEYVIWVYSGIDCYENAIKKEYVGGYSGCSVKICKGVYYRTGGSKGTPVEHEYMKSIGSGLLIFTNKNIIFFGLKSIKIPYKKIIGYTPYSDGIEIHKDSVKGKTITFKNFDSWFVVNLLSSIDI